MKTYTLAHVDAFTETIFGGNPAGVVLDADGLTEDQMKNIARELNLSETVFVFPGDETCDMYFRYFTSGKYEVKFCGHASIATLSEIARNGGSRDVQTLRVKTGVGILNMEIDAHKKLYTFDAAPVDLIEYSDSHEAFAERFGLSLSALDTRYPIMRDTILNYLYIPIKNEETLRGMTFDFAAIKKSFKEEGIVVFSLFTLAENPDSSIYARGLAPLTGVDEDPVTGSMMAGIYLYAEKFLSQTSTTQKIIQGNPLDRLGQVSVEKTNNTICVSGSAVPVFHTTLTI